MFKKLNFKKNKCINTGQKGFTLIELFMVVAIISMLSVNILIVMGGIRAKANDARRKIDLRTVERSLEWYGKGFYPVANSLTPLENITIQGISNAPRDPSGASYQYWSDGNLYKLYADFQYPQEDWLTIYPSDNPDYNVMLINSRPIVQHGSDEVDALRVGAWFEDTNDLSIWTAWAPMSVTYDMTVKSSSDYLLAISTKNVTEPDPYTYNNVGYMYNVEVRVDAVLQGVINTPGIYKPYFLGNLDIGNLSAGPHQITLTWTNDYCTPCGVPGLPWVDANIMIGGISLIPK